MLKWQNFIFSGETVNVFVNSIAVATNYLSLIKLNKYSVPPNMVWHPATYIYVYVYFRLSLSSQFNSYRLYVISYPIPVVPNPNHSNSTRMTCVFSLPFISGVSVIVVESNGNKVEKATITYWNSGIGVNVTGNDQMLSVATILPPALMVIANILILDNKSVKFN